MATTDRGGDDELDWLSGDILIALYHGDGVLNMTELKSETGIDTNQKITYRLNEKLEPFGFVEVSLPESEDGRQPAKVVSLTSRGEGMAGQLLDEDESDDFSISTEVEQLRAEVNKLESKVESQAETIEELVQGHDDMVGWIEDIEDDLDSP